MTAFVITIPDQTDRITRLKADFKIQGITDYQIIQGEQLPYSVVTSISRSHKNIVRMAQLNNMPHVLIMENDVRFPAPDGYSHYISKQPQHDDWDLYLAGCYCPHSIDYENIIGFSGLHCYMVNKRFYDTFISINEHKHLDSELTGKGKYILCNPITAVQYEGWSTNNRRFENYDNLLEGKRVYGINC